MQQPNARPPVVAAVLAGGRGSRMGSAVPKQFMEVGGKPLLQHTLEAFEAAPEVDLVVVVAAAEHRERVLAMARGCAKVADVVDGGATRSDSSRAAIRWAESRAGADARILLHDAARMLVPGRVIAAVAEALDSCQAVTAAVPASDSMVETDGAGPGAAVVAALDRSRLRRVQTPQGFRLGTIAEAYRRSDPAFTPTDDCSVVLRFLPEVPVRVVEGSERNLKVTTPVDLVVAEALLAGGV